MVLIAFEVPGTISGRVRKMNDGTDSGVRTRFWGAGAFPIKYLVMAILLIIV